MSVDAFGKKQLYFKYKSRSLFFNNHIMYMYMWETCVYIYSLKWACSDSSKQLRTFNTPGNLRALSVKRFLRSIFSSLQHIEIKVARESLNKRKQMHIHKKWNWFWSYKWNFTLLNRIIYLHSVNSNQQAVHMAN